MDKLSATRRSLLQLAGCLGASLAVSDWDVLAAALHHEPADTAEVGPSLLDSGELTDLEALTAQIIPTDAAPGAREAGVAHFIDRALSSFMAPLATQFVAGLRGLRNEVRGRYPESRLSFANLSSSQQIEYLASIEHSDFFASLRLLTVLGMFSNPSYGGNRDEVGWRLLGFQNDHAYSPPFGHYDREYPGFHVSDGAVP
jgi:gluconate 2-dehydrogenase subunit 3-like protein